MSETPTITPGQLHDKWTQFRQSWLEYLNQPYGLLSPVGLFWLDEQPQTFDEIPGAWHVHDSRYIVVRAEAKDTLLVDERPVDGEVVVFDAEQPKMTRSVRYHEVLIASVAFLAQTGQAAQLGIQPRDPYVASRRFEMGIPTYQPDPQWVVPARYEPYAELRPVVLHTIIENKIKDKAIFGRVTFTLRGKEHSLDVYAGPKHELHIPFRDRTGGVTTFAGARLVFAPRPASAGGGAFDFEMDFNQAVNGPCGYTPYTTCALPPPGNNLPVAIEAGEQIPVWMEQPSDWAR